MFEASGNAPPALETGGENTLQYRLIFMAQTTIKRVVNHTMLSTLGVSFSQGSALYQLTRGCEVSCQELSKLLGCGPSRISRLVQELQTRNFVECRREGTDRRVLQVSLTPEGRALAYRVPAVLRDAERLVLNVLSDEERRFLARFLCRIATNLDRIAE